MKKFLLTITLIGLFSCSETSNTNETYIGPPQQSFKFDLSKDVTTYTNGGYQLLSGTEILVGLNLKSEEINFYDLENEAQLKSVYYGEEEYNIYDVNNFFAINEDSILLNSPHSNTFFLIDGAGRLTNKFELDLKIPDDHQYQYFTLSSTVLFQENNLPFYYNKSKNEIFIPFMYNNKYTLDKEIAYRYPPAAVINLTEEKQQIRFVGEFPASFHKENVPFVFSCTIHASDGEKIVNFSYDDQVYFESINDFISIKSKYDQQQYTLFKKGVDPTTEQQMDALNGDFMYQYTILHPNDSSKLIRLCKHQQEIYKNDGGKLNQFLDAQWSILIYDMNTHTVINEYLLPKKIYDFKHLIPYKQGVLLVKSDDYKQLADEEFLLLDYFKLF